MPSTLPVDAVTLLCTAITVYSSLAIYVFQKPVTLGSVVMVVMMSASTTQALVGFWRVWAREEGETSAVPQRDVIDMVSSLGSGWLGQMVKGLGGVG